MVAPIPSATVIVLRERQPSYEVLLVRRNARLDFHGGYWVFPGGRIDADDYATASSDDVVEAARHAAVREAREEAGITIDAGALVLMSRWTTPPTLPKRFITWFFLGIGSAEPVQVDGGEIVAHQWLSPGQAVSLHQQGELRLPPPTAHTLLELSEFGSIEAALGHIRGRPVPIFAPGLPPS